MAQKLKIVFIVDDSKSALFTAASARAKITNGKVIVASDFLSSTSLLRAITRENPGVVLFAWRKALADSTLHKKDIGLLKQLRESASIGVLIPDHLGLESVHFESEKRTLQLSDFYLVTSELLFSLYSEKMRDLPPYGILHDIPNCELILRVKAEIKKTCSVRPKVIWVGNSEWGKRYGFNDHKGFFEVITPLGDLFKLHNNCMDLDVIDSSKKRLTQVEVLKRIRNSDVLLQVSKSEGSGLPILEALGLGTHVLTTPVGVSREVFGIASDQNFTSRNVNEIHKKLHELVQLLESDSKIEKFESYIETISSEIIPEGIRRDTISIVPKGVFINIYVRLFWVYRYFRKFVR